MLLSKRPTNPRIPSSKDLSFFCLILISPNSFYTSEPRPLSSHSFFPLAFSYEALFKFLFLSSFLSCFNTKHSCSSMLAPLFFLLPCPFTWANSLVSQSLFSHKIIRKIKWDNTSKIPHRVWKIVATYQMSPKF